MLSQDAFNIQPEIKEVEYLNEGKRHIGKDIGMNTPANLFIINPEQQIEDYDNSFGALKNNVTSKISIKKSNLLENYFDSREININAIQLDDSANTLRFNEIDSSP